jgi:hypothetical protein
MFTVVAFMVVQESELLSPEVIAGGFALKLVMLGADGAGGLLPPPPPPQCTNTIMQMEEIIAIAAFGTKVPRHCRFACSRAALVLKVLKSAVGIP